MIDYIEQLENRGYECKPSGENNVFICCPFHEEVAGSCSVNINTGGFHCFGCDASGSFYQLIAEIDGIDVGNARLLLNDEMDISAIVGGISSDLFEDADKSKRRFISVGSFASKFLDITRDYIEYMCEDRRVSLEICLRFGLRCGISGKWSGRVIFPIKNIDGRIVGFTGRAIYKDPHLKVRSHIAYPGAINDTLYGIYENKKLIQEKKAVILVEGPIDCLYLTSFNFPTVARLGKNLLSGAQVKLLLNHVDKVILSYDGDENGQIALEKEYERLRGVLPVIPVRLPKGMDPNDLTKSGVMQIYSKYF